MGKVHSSCQNAQADNGYGAILQESRRSRQRPPKGGGLLTSSQDASPESVSTLGRRYSTFGGMLYTWPLGQQDEDEDKEAGAFD